MTSTRWILVLSVNTLFALVHPVVGGLVGTLPAIIQSLAVNALLFLAPAAGWGDLAGSAPRSLPLRITRSIAISTAALILVLVVLRLASLPVTQRHAFTSMWVLTNAGFLAGFIVRPKRARRRSVTGAELVLASLAFTSAYGAYYIGATRIVPAQVDHDLEVQATGFGLLTRFEPLLLTDRRTIYYFAHPPLLHVYAAASFLYWGTLPSLEFYDAASQRARDARELRPFPPPGGSVLLKEESTRRDILSVDLPNYLLSAPAGGPPVKETVERVELARIYEHYRAEPHAIETRTPNILFGTLTVIILGIWAGRISHRVWIGALAAAAYASNPEVFVRSSYGGYFAIGGLTCALMLAGAERWSRWPRRRQSGSAVLSGALAALGDHKMVLLPIAIVCRSAWQRFRLTFSIHPVVGGFAIGIALFWCLGLVVAPRAFLLDHLHHHLMDRITHVNPLGYHNYPSRLDLWLEFAGHTAWLLLPAGVLALAADLTGRSGVLRVEGRRTRLLWLTWMVITAVAFTAIDWRMTKHLVPMLLPLHLALVPDRRSARWRFALGVTALAIALIWNASELVSIRSDFGAFVVTPAW